VANSGSLPGGITISINSSFPLRAMARWQFFRIAIQEHDTGTLVADARLFRAEARKQYRRALKRFTSLVMGDFLQADIGHLRLSLERRPDHWMIGALSRSDGRWLYKAQTTSGSHGKDVLLEFASAELGRTVLPEELSWIEAPGVVPGVE
jgi:hypothetical protein